MHTHLGAESLVVFFYSSFCTTNNNSMTHYSIWTQPLFFFFLTLPCLHRTCSTLDSSFDTEIKSSMWFSSSCHNMTSYSCRRCWLSGILHVEFGGSPPEGCFSFNKDLFEPTACPLSWPKMVGFRERSVTWRK